MEELSKIFSYGIKVGAENKKQSENDMQIHFLGTSAGTPTVERNVTSIALQPEGRSEWYMVDCGEGTQQQLLRSPLSLPKLTKIFITHLHGDHCYGLPGLLSSRGLMQASEPLDIYGPRGLKPMLEAMLKYSYVRPMYKLRIHEFNESSELYDDVNEKVKTVKLSHDVPSYAYVIQEQDFAGAFDIDKAKAAGIPPGPDYGRLKNGETVTLEDGRIFSGAEFVSDPINGRKIIIAGDNDSAELLANDMADADVMIHEATHTIEAAAGLSFKSRHSTAASVCEIAKNVGLANLILTHFSPRFHLRPQNGRSGMDDIADEVKAHYDGSWHLARDFDQYKLGRDKKVECVFRRKNRWESK